MRRLPPLNTLRAFEAAARSESFTRAAKELHVTQGAISQQVKSLEAALGIRLFARERQRLALTDSGRDYLAVVRDALDRIAAGTDRVVKRQNSGILTISTSPDFAAKWLVNRLGSFAEKFPDIDLRISATLHHVDFAREDVDVAVRHGDGTWPGLECRAPLSGRTFPGVQPQARRPGAGALPRPQTCSSFRCCGSTKETAGRAGSKPPALRMPLHGARYSTVPAC